MLDKQDQKIYDQANEFLNSHGNDPWELVSACREVRIARAANNMQALSAAMDNLRKVYSQCIVTFVTKKSKTTGYGTTV